MVRGLETIPSGKGAHVVCSAAYATLLCFLITRAQQTSAPTRVADGLISKSRKRKPCVAQRRALHSVSQTKEETRELVCRECQLIPEDTEIELSKKPHSQRRTNISQSARTANLELRVCSSSAFYGFGRFRMSESNETK